MKKKMAPLAFVFPLGNKMKRIFVRFLTQPISYVCVNVRARILYMSRNNADHERTLCENEKWITK